MKIELTEFRISKYIRTFVLSGFVALTLTASSSVEENKVKVFAVPNDEIVVSHSWQEKHVDPKELECMAKNIYFEANTEGYQGKLAVATVTLNRSNSKKYPETICGVVWQRGQFSWTRDGKSDHVRDHEKYLESLRVAEQVLIYEKRSNLISSNVKYFHRNTIRPRWSYKMKRVVQIGKHVFYQG
jgi:spore germination cell wall hydrolase CwlJ-like protein